VRRVDFRAAGRHPARVIGEIMQPRSCSAFVLAAALALPAAVMAQTTAETPTAETIVKRALDAAGGLDAFSRLGILLVDRNTEETAQNGTQTKTSGKAYFKTPGPTPGRIELTTPPIVSGDDGNSGWAVVNGQPDPRPSTKLMIRRLVRTSLFSLMLPFSLTWDEVSVTGVSATTAGDVPVWRLSVGFTKSFFHSPQISTDWIIDINRKTYAVVQARCPATDLGRGIKADGMLISWGKPQIVGGVVLPGEQRTVGLTEVGAVKAHNRFDHLRYELLDSRQNASLFTDPVPPELRPTPQVGPEAARPPKS
jgi:hypothetical protein